MPNHCFCNSHGYECTNELHKNKLCKFTPNISCPDFVPYPEEIKKDSNPQINPCDFCLCKEQGNCDPSIHPRCKTYEYHWCNLEGPGCGFATDKESCYGYENCPNVREFYSKKNVIEQPKNFEKLLEEKYGGFHDAYLEFLTIHHEKDITPFVFIIIRWTNEVALQEYIELRIQLDIDMPMKLKLDSILAFQGTMLGGVMCPKPGLLYIENCFGVIQLPYRYFTIESKCEEKKRGNTLTELRCANCGHQLVKQESNKDWWDLYCEFCHERRATYNKHYLLSVTQIKDPFITHLEFRKDHPVPKVKGKKYHKDHPIYKGHSWKY